jgi:hypothetical protein
LQIVRRDRIQRQWVHRHVNAGVLAAVTGHEQDQQILRRVHPATEPLQGNRQVGAGGQRGGQNPVGMVDQCQRASTAGENLVEPFGSQFDLVAKHVFCTVTAERKHVYILLAGRLRGQRLQRAV